LVFFIAAFSSPVVHALPCDFEISCRDGLALVADAVHSYDPAVLHEKPEHAGVQLPHVAQLKQSLAKRLG
jgi:hypothetical protein